MKEVYVDGSFTIKRPDVVGWGWFHSHDDNAKGGLEGDICALHQVGGEIHAAMDAISYWYSRGELELTILHDYIGVREWANGGWRAKNPHTKEYIAFIKEYRAKGMKINFVKIDAAANPADELARWATGAEYAH